MGKKKKKKKRQTPKVAKQAAEQARISPVNSVELPMGKPDPDSSTDTSPPSTSGPPTKADESSATKLRKKEIKEPVLSAVEEKLNRNIQAKSRIRRMLPDIIRVALALTVIGVGAAIWWKPPLMTASFPVTTFKYRNNGIKEATLYRPIAMQERYYLKLPEKVANKYEWFAIDRRREVVALTEEPKHTFFGKKAIKRSDPLGIDLEFRKIDGHEWLIYFYADAIVFSNNLLCVRLDTKKMEK